MHGSNSLTFDIFRLGGFDAVMDRKIETRPGFIGKEKKESSGGLFGVWPKASDSTKATRSMATASSETMWVVYRRINTDKTGWFGFKPTRSVWPAILNLLATYIPHTSTFISIFLG